MNSFKTNGYVPRLSDGKSKQSREVTKQTPDKKIPPRRTSVIFLRYFFLSVLFIFVGAAFAYLPLTHNTEACNEILAAHFSPDGVSKILFIIKAFAVRALPVLLICIGSLTFFSGGISTVVISLCSAVFGVGTCAVLALESPFAAAYITWTALLALLYVCCAVFARKFFVFLFVERRGYSNVKGLLIYIGVCLAFLAALFIISVIYVFALFNF